jgi:hypothetical protein
MTWFKKHPNAALAAGFGLGLLVGVGMLVGALVTMSVHDLSAPVFPEVALHATATDSGDTFAMATGQMYDGVEGVFFLDFLTGDLQCCVLDRRTGLVTGYYAHNVINDLGIDPSRKNPRYLMVTGFAPGQGGARRADSLLYVADANTGNFAIYAMPFNRGAIGRGGQAWPMSKVFQGSARNLVIRGQ